MATRPWPGVMNMNAHLAVAKAVVILAQTMTPQQRLSAAARLRATRGNAAEREYFRGLADALQDYRPSSGVPRSQGSPS